MNFWEILTIGLIMFINLVFMLMTLGMMFGAKMGAPFIPTGRRTVEKMLEIADIKASDLVFDLGCGDGRLVLAAAKKCQQAIGIEVSPPVYWLAKLRLVLSGQKNAKILFGNFFKKPEILEADVIFTFLLDKAMNSIFTEIWPQLKKGTRLVSHAFPMKNIKPNKIIPRDKHHGKIFLFIK